MVLSLSDSELLNILMFSQNQLRVPGYTIAGSTTVCGRNVNVIKSPRGKFFRFTRGNNKVYLTSSSIQFGPATFSFVQ